MLRNRVLYVVCGPDGARKRFTLVCGQNGARKRFTSVCGRDKDEKWIF
ncbi:MAG: hypothetical protein LIP12_11245 [Clostridiales bacterium]|nr:hypothetical protein [Clostridiales bacterium]